MSITATSGAVAAQQSDSWTVIAEAPARHDTRATVDVVGLDEHAGWDCLLQAILADPAARFPASRRRHGIQVLADALRQLRLREATVLALRYGVSLEGRACPRRSRRAVAEQLRISYSHVTALEGAGVAALRAALRRSAAGCQRQTALEMCAAMPALELAGALAGG